MSGAVEISQMKEYLQAVSRSDGNRHRTQEIQCTYARHAFQTRSVLKMKTSRYSSLTTMVASEKAESERKHGASNLLRTGTGRGGGGGGTGSLRFCVNPQTRHHELYSPSPTPKCNKRVAMAFYFSKYPKGRACTVSPAATVPVSE